MSDPSRADQPTDAGRRTAVALVLVGLVVAAASEAYALFGGEYLPYIDWSNHLGLISIFAHGESSGAFAYAERSWAPGPYFLFYAVSALFSQVWSVPAAAKLAVVVAAMGAVASFAFLAWRLGRPVVAALLAPLVLYGYARGYGFSSFIFSLPLVWAVLGTLELLLDRARRGACVGMPGAAFGVAVLLSYLGHALVALPVAAAVVLRLGVFAVGKPLRTTGRVVAAMGLAVLPAAIAAVIAWSGLGPEHGAPVNGQVRVFVWNQSLSARWAGMGGHMLERGSSAHWWTMYGVAGLWALLVLAWLVGAVRGWRAGRKPTFDEGDRGALVYALFFGLLYAAGPESIGWPTGVWMVYPRYATLGALTLFLLPRPRLPVVVQAGLAAVMIGLVAHNASLNRGHVSRFSAWASRYNPVRAAVPPKATVMALTAYDPGDWIASHHALGSLYFYHLCDGAAYSAFLFDHDLLPVHLKPDRPQAPPWNNVGAYDPNVHGVAFDYLVLRGRRFIDMTERAGRHAVVLRHDGWVVFKTQRP